MKRITLLAIGAAGLAAVAWWRRHPRFGAGWVNGVVDPWLIRQGIAGRARGEIGLLEHVGRSSGIVRITPVRPVPTDDGFRIVVPLGLESQWARNVLAAGHCRLQVGDVLYELDEPVLVAPSRVEGVPLPVGLLMDWLGFRYLRLHRFEQHQGALSAAAPTDVTATQVPGAVPAGSPL